jgi:hypothetical protein
MQVKYLALLSGMGPLPAVGLYVNAVVSSLSVVFLYYVTALPLGSPKTGFLAGIIYTLWPAHLFYAIVLSPEYLHVFFCLLSLLLLIVALRGVAGHKRLSCALAISAGIALALSGFFKTTDRIILIALLITLGIRAIRTKRMKPGKAPKSRMLALFFHGGGAYVFLLVISYVLSVQAGYFFMEKDSGREVNRSSYAYFLYVGLSPTTNGTWKEAAASYYVELAEELDDYDKLAGAVLDKLRRELRDSDHLGKKFWNDKIRLAWASDNYLWLPDMTMNPQTDGPMKPGQWLQTFASYTQIFYMIVCLLALFASFCLLVKGETRLLFLSALIIFGFAAVMAVIEVQPRYKCVVYPFLSILAAYGMTRAPSLLSAAARAMPSQGRNVGSV